MMHGVYNVKKNTDMYLQYIYNFMRVRRNAKSDYLLRIFCLCPSVCLSLYPHETTRLPLDGISWNFVFEFFSEPLENIKFLLKSGRLHEDVHLW